MNIVNAVNRWRSGKEIPRLAPIPTGIIIFTLLVCVLPFGTGFSKWSCTAACIVGVAFLIFMTRSARALAPVCIPAMLLFLITASPVLPSMLISVTVTVGAGAFLINGSRSYALLLMLPAAYGLSLVTGKDWRIAFLCAVCLPALVALSRAAYSGASRLNAICRTSAALAASAAMLTVILFITNDIDFALDTLRAYIDAIRDSLTASLREIMLTEPELYENIAQTAEEYTGALLSLVPALTVCLLNYLAFTAQKIHTALMLSNGFAGYVSKKSSEFKMSRASGAVFFVSCALVILCSYLGGIELMETAENVMLILLPGLSLIGSAQLLSKHEGKRRNILLIILIGFLLLTYTAAGLIILASIGAFSAAKRSDGTN